MTDTTNTARTPLTTAELLVQAEARVAKLKQRLVTENVLASIAADTAVEFRYGRNVDEKKDEAGNVVREARVARILSGVVVGVRDVTIGEGDKARTSKQIKVRVGEGFDAEDFVIPATAITKVGSDETPQDEAAEGDDATDPMNAA